MSESPDSARALNICSHVGWGVIVSIVLIVLKEFLVERWQLGANIERASYEWVQGLISPDAGAVAVVDISALEPVPTTLITPNGTFDVPGGVTPPNALAEIVSAIEESEPCAIGVDINLAPYEAGDSPFLTPEHEQLLDLCSKYKNVYLGIYADTNAAKSERRRPDWLLSDKRYRAICAVLMYKPENTPGETGEDTRWMPPAQYMQVQTLGAALAEAYLKARGEPESKFIVESRTAASWCTRPVIDYSGLEKIQSDQTVEARDRHSIDLTAKGFFKDKMVLIGGATVGRFFDAFVVEGHSPPPVAGVDIYACAANSLVHRRVLREFTPLGRFIVDAALSLLLLLAFIGLLWALRKTPLRTSGLPRLQRMCSCAVALLAVGVGVLAVGYTRVLWDDWIFVLPALLVHSSFERGLKHAVRQVRGYFVRSISTLNQEGNQ